MYSFEIEGLFGDRDIKFNFEKPLLILIGENGVGKSTVLSILNCILERNTAGLKEYDFDLIKYKVNETTYCLYRDDMDKIPNDFEVNYNLLNDSLLQNKMLLKDVAKELQITYSMFTRHFNEKKFYWFIDRMEYLQFQGIATPLADNFFREIVNEKHTNHPTLQNFFDPICSELKGELLYFPTYRRVEEEAYKVGHVIDKDLGKNVIKFGMQDVQKIFNNIIEQIKTETINGVQKVMDSLFTDLLSELNLSNEYDSIDLKNKREDLEIILKRSENSLPFSMKKTLEKLDVILDKKDLTDKEQFILYFITKYLNIYESSKVHDEKINLFIKVCNSYFKDKKFIYDAKNVHIKLVSKYDLSKEIQLKSLSSGEKQIVSLFASLYLTGKEDYVILFDEPELSLSIKWQEKLLKDILETKKCNFMTAVTHSPFIVPEELRKYTLSFGSTVQRKGEYIDG
ncbi:AAA family ATPase [Bacillus cereus]|uniref:ATP-binding protein n=1 Tax=Bacillus cereus (strain ZK / E33L) TaxID=288681 RepID=Q637C8_BACCZ|nr:AAA family ATPase [Bacillus cereus]AAU16859.1 ATP-binding protein [Bacillus cereus E33L]AJI31241.1 ABC transporter family protein [Bacillus cereus E33L]QQA22697.1 AAA family ATPase [Bacillus cereus]